MRRSENSKSKSILTVAVALTLTLSAGAMAAGSHDGGHGSGGHSTSAGSSTSGGHGHAGGHSNAAGEPGDKSKATRTIRIEMTDNRYSPEEIRTKAGETIRFVVVNKGELVHEFNIGTPDMHKVHQKEMMKPQTAL